MTGASHQAVEENMEIIFIGVNDIAPGRLPQGLFGLRYADVSGSSPQFFLGQNHLDRAAVTFDCDGFVARRVDQVAD